MIIRTERLILRHWKESDAPEMYAYAKDPDVGSPCGWKAHASLEESARIIKENFLEKQEAYAICLPNDKAIGCIELRLDTDMTDREDECELGFWLGKPYWGQGLMKEAVNAILRHAFCDLGFNRVFCGYYEGNQKSKRVQEKCGFRYLWTTEGIYLKKLNETRTGHVNAMTKEEWFLLHPEEK